MHINSRMNTDDLNSSEDDHPAALLFSDIQPLTLASLSNAVHSINGGLMRGGSSFESAFERSRYIALMELSHLLQNDNIETFFPPPTPEIDLDGPDIPSIIIEVGGDDNAIGLEEPPLPRNPPGFPCDLSTPAFPRLRNVLRNRRRFQRQVLASSSPLVEECEPEEMEDSPFGRENYLLREEFENADADEVPANDNRGEFARELLYTTLFKNNNPSKK